ncbi:MAG: alpha/beta hydrolase [Roseibium sp.]
MLSSGSLYSVVRIPVVVLSLLFLLAACTSRPETGALAINTQQAEGAKSHDILIASTRAKDDSPDTYFGGNRSATLNYAKADISVPPTHVPGAIEWPSTLPGNPKTDFVARSAGYIDNEDAFLAELNAKLRKLPKGKREIMLFIHGYNTMFAEGLYRFTQFVHDANADVVPVLFTWASQGHVTGYIYDLNSVAIARDNLEQTMMLLAKSEADSIGILAHSMGNYLLLETGRQMKQSNKRILESKIGSVVMAAPDIDIDLFKSTLRHVGRPNKPYIIVVSRDDSALRVSRKLAGGIERVGAYSDDEELAELGAVVIDVTDLKSSQTSSHSKFAALAEYSPGLRQALLKSGLTNTSSVTGPTTLSGDLGGFVGTTAQAAVSLPIQIIAAPFRGLSGGAGPARP